MQKYFYREMINIIICKISEIKRLKCLDFTHRMDIAIILRLIVVCKHLLN